MVQLDARTDFRLEKLAGSPVFYTPADERPQAGPRPAPSSSLTGRAHGEPVTLTVKGHPVEVPQAAGGVARFDFARPVLEAPRRLRLPRARRRTSTR